MNNNINLRVLVYGNALKAGVQEMAKQAVKEYMDKQSITTINNNKEETIMATETINNNVNNVKEENIMENNKYFRTTAAKAETLANNGKMTADEIANYCAMYPKCNGSIAEIIAKWGAKATPYKAQTGKGINKKLLAAMEAEENMVNAMPEESVTVTPVIAEPVAAPTVTEVLAPKTEEELFKERVQRMYNTFFVNNPDVAIRRHNDVVKQLIINAANSKVKLQADKAFDFVNVYMAEDAICKAIWGTWRNRTNDKVRLGFVHMVLNKMVTDKVLIPVYYSNHKLRGFKVSALYLGNKYGTNLIYKARNGFIYEVTLDKVKCRNTGVEKTTTKVLLHWLSKTACLIGKLGSATDGASKATTSAAIAKTDNATVDASTNAETTKTNANDSNKKVNICTKNIEAAMRTTLKEMLILYLNGRAEVNTMKIYCSLFPTPLAMNGELTIQDYIIAYGLDATPNTVTEKPVQKEQQEQTTAVKEEKIATEQTIKTEETIQEEKEKPAQKLLIDDSADKIEKPVNKKVTVNNADLYNMVIADVMEQYTAKKISLDVFNKYISLFGETDMSIDDIAEKYGYDATPNNIKNKVIK